VSWRASKVSTVGTSKSKPKRERSEEGDNPGGEGVKNLPRKVKAGIKERKEKKSTGRLDLPRNPLPGGMVKTIGPTAE